MEIKTVRRFYKIMKLWKDYRGFIILIMLCLILFTLFLYLTNIMFGKPNEFGDSAGATNGLFSALAFAGVIYAIFLQKNELTLQRQELKDTRTEIAGQRKESELQNNTLKHQRFENTFFQMLNLQQEIISGLYFPYEKKVIVTRDTDRGREVEEKMESRQVVGRELFRFSFEDALHLHNNKKYKGMREVLEQCDINAYEYSNTPTYYDHYFRNLYRIIKFVHESPLIKGFEERYQYTSIVRGQLSRYELIWLYYNALSCYGNEFFKPLIERYALLKNIRDDLLVKNTIYEKYEDSAFEKTIPADSDR